MRYAAQESRHAFPKRPYGVVFVFLSGTQLRSPITQTNGAFNKPPRPNGINGANGHHAEDTLLQAGEGIAGNIQRREKEAKKQATSWRNHVMAAQDLCEQRFPEVKYIIPGLF